MPLTKDFDEKHSERQTANLIKKFLWPCNQKRRRLIKNGEASKYT